MRPPTQDIAVPPFPPGVRWIGADPPPVDRICARGSLLVHFVDAVDLNSVRTLPYATAWERRYGDLGLTLVAVNSPRFPLTAEAGKLASALERLEISFPVAMDVDYRIWHDYGCEGWPSLFLWGRGGTLRWFHFGEGEYEATEAAIQEELRTADADLDLPPPLSPIRPSDSHGALVAPPTPEIFPGGSPAQPWEAGEADEPLELEYEAAGAWVTVDGRGVLRASLDRGPEREIEVGAPGAYELAGHDRHESHYLSLRASGGLSIYSVGFAPGVP